MKKSFIFLADGFEELEALSPIDIMRRAGMELVTVSIHDRLTVTGAHGVPVTADAMIDEIDCTDAEWLICPGGLPGAQYLHESDEVNTLLLRQYNAGGKVAAICASLPWCLLLRESSTAAKRPAIPAWRSTAENL